MHHAELHPRQIGHRPDRRFRIAKATRTVVIEGHANKIIGSEGIKDLLADFTIHHVVHWINRSEDIGQPRNLGYFDDVVERAKADRVHVNHAILGLFHRAFFFAKLGGMEHLKADAPVGLFFNNLTRRLDDLNRVIAIWMGV